MIFIGHSIQKQQDTLLKSSWNILEDRSYFGSQSSLGKFKKIEIVSSIFSDHNAMRLAINYRKISVNNTNTGRLNNTVLNNQETTKEIKEEIKNFQETNDREKQ